MFEKVVRVGHGRLSGVLDDMAADGHGRVWLAGWGGPVYCGGPGPIPDGEQAPNYACGYTYIARANAPSGRISPIRATRSGKESDIALGPRGSVWLVVPQFRRCPHRSCDRSALVRYDPGTHRFTRYAIPRKMWPEANDVQSVYGFDADLYVRPNETIWVVAFDLSSQNEVRLIRFRHGSFVSKILHLPGRVHGDVGAMIDSRGNFWFNGISGYHSVLGDGKEYVTNPATGVTKILPDPHGIVMQTGDGQMWYVKAPPMG